LKAELQAKDTTIKKLKANITRLNKTSTTNNVKKDIDEIETINIELEHKVTKLIAENEHLKQTYKQLYDSIKPSCVYAKEHVDSLVNQLNQKFVEITDLNAQFQEKLDPVTLAPKDKNNRETHIYYLKHTMEQAAILNEIVEQAKSLNPLDSASYSASKYVKQIQELLGYVRDTCLDIHKANDYSRFTWVKFVASKDEAPDFIIKFLKMIQARLNRPVRNIRTDNGTELVNQTLRSYYESVGTQEESLPHATNPRIDKKNQLKTIYVNFDKQTAMATEQLSLVPRLQSMTPATSCSRLNPNLIPQQPCIPPPRDNWDCLFQPIFDEYFNPPTIVVSPVPVAAAPRTVDLADSPVSTSIDQDAPSISIPSTQDQEHSLIISQGFEESPKTSHFHDDPLHESLHEDSTSQGSSSNVRPIHTLFESLNIPMVEKSKLDEDLQGTPVDATLYRDMIGSLLYLTSSRPALIYAVCLCAWIRQSLPKST
ncbi:ribonuclease H-like domain-containing protein, partial [Tanacetum coccineum]